MTEPITTTQATERGLLAGRTARCGCGATCPSEGPAPGFTGQPPFLTYRGPGSQEALETCVCGYYRVAHGMPHIPCKDFRLRGPAEFDSFYCGHGGWD